MSLLERIAACRRWSPEAYRPFLVGGEAVGRIDDGFARRLADFPVFAVGERAVELDPRLDDFAARSAAVAEALERLRAAGDFPGWRDEAYPVVRRWGEAPRLQIERAAVPRFGVRGFGVHMNGFLRDAEGLKMWVGRRSMTKPTGPGKLDQLVAGGQPHGIGIRDNMIKECAEEAGIPPALAAEVRPVGLISYRCERPEGLRDDVLYCYDLELPAGFEPRNEDGEVEAFYLWPIARVVEELEAGESFKFNCALVAIDFLARHGLLDPDRPDYDEILHGMRRPEAERGAA